MFDAIRSGDCISSLKSRLPPNSRSRITSKVERSPKKSSAESIGQPESRRLRPSLIEAPEKTCDIRSFDDLQNATHVVGLTCKMQLIGGCDGNADQSERISLVAAVRAGAGA